MGRQEHLLPTSCVTQELSVRPRHDTRQRRVPRQGVVEHPAEPNGIPFSWRPTIEQADSIAGWVNLGRGGSIMGGESLRDSFVIYSEQAINVIDFTGDALGWRRRAISSAAGLVGKEAGRGRGRALLYQPR